MKSITKKKRGAPLGNKNALKHGYYSRELNKDEQLDFSLAAGVEGMTEEITLIRFEMKKAVTSGDIHRLIPLSKAAYALEKLIRTHHRFLKERENSLEKAMENVIRNILVPLGPNAVSLVIADKLPDKVKPLNN